MSDGNYPAGAQYDSSAPWNERSAEKTELEMAVIIHSPGHHDASDDGDLIYLAELRVYDPEDNHEIKEAAKEFAAEFGEYIDHYKPSVNERYLQPSAQNRDRLVATINQNS